jgi:ectoine hydroxylase-related dioxygenase (phytanoyl-CoA dioxygenase family)
MAHVQKVHASEDITKINAILDEDGCIVIEGLLDEAQVKDLQEELYTSFNKVPVCQGNFFGFATKRMSSIFARSKVSREMAVAPALLGVMDNFLLKSCREYQVNLTQAIQICPGEPAQIIHTDELLFPFDHPGTQAMINCMWAVDDFTAENGATHVVPGSHKWAKDRQPEPHEITQGEMKAGSVLIYFGGLLHGGGGNKTKETLRTGLVISYCLGWLRQTENHYLALPLPLVSTFPKRLQRLLGYFVHEPNLGCVEGQDPIRLVEGAHIANGRFEEFMPAEIQPVLEEHRKNSGAEAVFNDRKAYERKQA